MESVRAAGKALQPEQTAGSPDLRTVDNAGYVDPGGRTRQVSAGCPSTVGREEGNVPPPHQPVDPLRPPMDEEVGVEHTE